MDKNELLEKRARENKDPQIIIVRTGHPKLNAIPSFLNLIFPYSLQPSKTYCRLSKNQIAF